MVAAAAVALMLLALAASPATGWFHSDREVRSDVSAGDVEVDLRISYLMDTSEDGATVGDDYKVSADGLSGAYAFGFKDQASATVSGNSLSISDMAKNDSIRIGFEGSIVLDSRAAVRVALTVTGDNSDRFERTLLFRGSEVSVGQGWTATDKGTYEISSEDTYADLKLPLDAASGSASCGISLKVEAYQLNAYLPDGTVQRDEAQGNRVVQRFAGSDSASEWEITFAAPSDATYSVGRCLSDGQEMEIGGETLTVLDGIAVSGTSSGTDVDLSSVLTTIKVKLLESDVYYSILKPSLTIVTGEGAQYVSDFKDEADTPSADGEYSLTEEDDGTYTLVFCVEDFRGCYRTSTVRCGFHIHRGRPPGRPLFHHERRGTELVGNDRWRVLRGRERDVGARGPLRERRGRDRDAVPQGGRGLHEDGDIRQDEEEGPDAPEAGTPRGRRSGDDRGLRQGRVRQVDALRGEDRRQAPGDGRDAPRTGVGRGEV